jgi:integrase
VKGSVYKRCTRCGRTVKGRGCSTCSGSSISWAYRVDVGRNAEGQRLERRRGGFDTRREAERELAETVAALNAGSFVPSKPTTVAEYLCDEWLEATAPPHVGYETWGDRKRNIGHHVVPHLGDLRLQDLNAGHLNRLYAHLMKEGRVDGEGGLSPTTVRRIHAILRKAFNDAVRWGLLQSNPTEFADPPPARVEKAARRRSMRTWNREQLRTFLDETRDHAHHALWILAATTGMRRSELLGLCWPNVDLNAGTVLVRTTVILAEDGYELADAQKSAQSGRTIHLDHRTIARLREHRAELNAIAETAGSDWNGHGLVFPTPEGTWWNPPAISLAFRRAVRAIGLPRIRFHD